MTTLFTIGYQETTVPAFLGALELAGVRLLVDVRAVAASRRPGFSKRPLAAELEAAGIRYLHLQGLGTPAEGRQAARAGRYDEMRRIYEAHLDTERARQDMATLEEIASTGTPCCLLCFERHHEHCHRQIICERLSAHLGLEAVHLLP